MIALRSTKRRLSVFSPAQRKPHGKIIHPSMAPERRSRKDSSLSAPCSSLDQSVQSMVDQGWLRFMFAPADRLPRAFFYISRPASLLATDSPFLCLLTPYSSSILLYPLSLP